MKMLHVRESTKRNYSSAYKFTENGLSRITFDTFSYDLMKTFESKSYVTKSINCC